VIDPQFLLSQLRNCQLGGLQAYLSMFYHYSKFIRKSGREAVPRPC